MCDDHYFNESLEKLRFYGYLRRFVCQFLILHRFIKFSAIRWTFACLAWRNHSLPIRGFRSIYALISVFSFKYFFNKFPNNLIKSLIVFHLLRAFVILLMIYDFSKHLWQFICRLSC